MEEFLDLDGGVGRYVKANGQESNDFPMILEFLQVVGHKMFAAQDGTVWGLKQFQTRGSWSMKKWFENLDHWEPTASESKVLDIFLGLIFAFSMESQRF